MFPHQELENKFAQWVGYPPENAVACSSGTAALHLALESLNCRTIGGIQAEILIPQFTMIACARAATMTGMQPVFVDCDQRLLIDVSLAREQVTRKTTAIMPVHIYGRTCDMASINTLALKHDLRVIEDLAEAHGIKPHPSTSASCWSFYKNKIVAGEEGGIIIFKDKYRADIARELRCLGFTKDHNFLHLPRGCNYRLADSLALLILHSLERVERNLLRRTQVVRWYDKHIPEKHYMPPRDVPWVYDLKVSLPEQQKAIVERLSRQGIPIRYGFKPMAEQPEYGGKQDPCLVAHQMSNKIVYLPVYPNMSHRDVWKICRALNNLLP